MRSSIILPTTVNHGTGSDGGSYTGRAASTLQVEAEEAASALELAQGRRVLGSVVAQQARWNRAGAAGVDAMSTKRRRQTDRTQNFRLTLTAVTIALVIFALAFALVFSTYPHATTLFLRSLEPL